MIGVYALKTFRDEYLDNAQTKDRFRKEAGIWVDMERHPYLVRAHFVDEVGGRLFIGLEYIAPDEQGLNSLDSYLRHKPPDFVQSLRWAIQFCHGMEYAYSKGIRCHRDIKPANIMIDQDKTVKITDFGLAGVLGVPGAAPKVSPSDGQGAVGLFGETMEGTGFGTPEFMPPEQFTDASSCDGRSDIYSFGIVLYQMATGGHLPYTAPARAFGAWYKVHSESSMPALRSPLAPIIARCLEKARGNRYRDFRELRAELEPLLGRLTGEAVRPPESGALEAREWSNKGVCLDRLGRYEEAVRCCDKALELDPRNAHAWNNKGSCLHSLGRREEAVCCIDKALSIDPLNASAWCNRGADHYRLGRYEEAIRCYDKALELRPLDVFFWCNKGQALNMLDRYEEAMHCYDRAMGLDSRNADAWFGRGVAQEGLGRKAEAVRSYEQFIAITPARSAGDVASTQRHIRELTGKDEEEAIQCCDRVLELDARDASAWNDKGDNLCSLGRYDEAIRCFDRLLELDPSRATAWYKKGICLASLDRASEALRCYDKSLELDPQHLDARVSKGALLHRLGRYDEAIICYDRVLELDPRYGLAWYNKGLGLQALRRCDEAIRCYDEVLELDPRHTLAWIDKGNGLHILGRYDEAIGCYDKHLELRPRDAKAWYNKALAQDNSDRREDAVRSYRQFIALAQAQYAEQVAYAQRRIRELEGK